MRLILIFGWRYFFTLVLYVIMLFFSVYLEAKNELEDSYYLNKHNPKPLNVEKDVKILKIKKDNNDVDIGMPCSCSLVSDVKLLVCNYNKLYLLNLENGGVKELSPPDRVVTWNPTGVFYDKKNKKIYIANYHGKNLLVFKFCSNNELVLERNIINDEMIGPENVEVSNSGTFIAVADFDGNKLIAFDDKGQKRWSYPIPSAHGVTISGDFVYCSGLASKEIYKFDRTGKLIKKVGKEGFGKDGFFWPTGVAYNKWNGKLYVTDAHTGKITEMDSDLNSLQSVGGNGPGLNLFNMPYGITFADQNKIFVCDTFKSRFLTLDFSENKVKAIYQGYQELGDLVLEKGTKNSTIDDKNVPMGKFYTGRINNESKVKFKGLDGLFFPSYSGFIREGGQENLMLAMPISFFSGSLYYWMLGTNIEFGDQLYTVFGSPQNPNWIVYDGENTCSIQVGFDFWLNKNMLIGSNGYSVELLDLVKFAAEKFKLFYKSIDDHKDLFISMEYCLGPNVKDRIMHGFVTEKGKQFLKETHGLSLPDSELIEASSKFLEDVKNEKTKYVVEISIVRMFLSGLKNKLKRKIS